MARKIKSSSREEVLKEIRKILIEQGFVTDLEAEDLRECTSICELYALDIFGCSEVVVHEELEHKYGIGFQDVEIDNCRTLGDLVSIVVERIN